MHKIKIYNKENFPGILAWQENNYNSQELIAPNIEYVEKDLSAKKIFLIKQVHGTNIVDVDQDDTNMQEGDAMVTSQRQIALGIKTADCVPVLLFSESIIGAAHCGWRSAHAGIISKIAQKMRSKMTEKETIYAFIGPSIQKESYEVGGEFYDSFLDQNTSDIDFFYRIGNSDKFLFDLPAFVRSRLDSEGIVIQNYCQEDTFLLPNKYPSYRRACKTGEKYRENILSVILIEP